MKKAHWLTTPEGKERMRRIQKKRWRKIKANGKNGTSHADKLIKREAPKHLATQQTNRSTVYRQAAALAVEHGELKVLIREVSASATRLTDRLTKVVGE